MLAHKAVGKARETVERVLDSGPEQLAPEQLVIKRHTHRKLVAREFSAELIFDIVFPAGKEEFPLEIGHLDQLCALPFPHPSIIEWDKQSFGIA